MAERPAIFSARYAGAGADDAANNAKLLRALDGLPFERRRARYRCALVFVDAPADGSRDPAGGRGSLGGIHSRGAARRGGFGYDPYFWLPELGLTAAELDLPEKNRLQPSRHGDACTARYAAGAATLRRAAARGAPLIDASLALYVHMPWCVRKCPYCDFNSHQLKSAQPDAGYIDALIRDFDSEAPRLAGRRIDTVFFGGGTPSLFQPEEFARLLGALRQRIAFADDVEITMEANPGTIERGRFAGYAEAGINRVSLGAQSFDAARARSARAAFTRPRTRIVRWRNCAPRSSIISISI